MLTIKCNPKGATVTIAYLKSHKPKRYLAGVRYLESNDSLNAESYSDIVGGSFVVNHLHYEDGRHQVNMEGGGLSPCVAYALLGYDAVNDLVKGMTFEGGVLEARQLQFEAKQKAVKALLEPLLLDSYKTAVKPACNHQGDLTMTTISYRSLINDNEREEAFDLGFTQFETPKKTHEWVVDSNLNAYNTSFLWKNAYHSYHNIELGEQDSANLDVYHKLVARMLSNGRWIACKGKSNPDMTAEGGYYTLGLIRHFYKDGDVYEMSVQLPINRMHPEISMIAVYSHYGDGTIGEFLPLADAAENMNAFINKIEGMFAQAATFKNTACEVKVLNMAVDYDLLKEQFLVKKGAIIKRPCIQLGVNDNNSFGDDFGFIEAVGESLPFSEHKDLRVLGFDTSLIMQVAFTHGSDEYIYNVPFNDYQKAVAAKWTGLKQA